MVNVHSVQVVVCGQCAEYKLHCCLPCAPRVYHRKLFKCVVKCLGFREKREIASLIFAFARGFTWFASGSLIYCVLLNAIVEKTHNSQLLDSRI